MAEGPEGLAPVQRRLPDSNLGDGPNGVSQGAVASIRRRRNRTKPTKATRASVGSATAYGASGNATLGWVVTGWLVLEISGPVLATSGPYEGVKGPPALPASVHAGAHGQDAPAGAVVAGVFGPVLFSKLWEVDVVVAGLA